MAELQFFLKKSFHLCKIWFFFFERSR